MTDRTADPVVEAGKSLAEHLDQTCQLQAAEVVWNLIKLCNELMAREEARKSDLKAVASMGRFW